jgi:hypothetical protein
MSTIDVLRTELEVLEMFAVNCELYAPTLAKHIMNTVHNGSSEQIHTLFMSVSDVLND